MNRMTSNAPLVGTASKQLDLALRSPRSRLKSEIPFGVQHRVAGLFAGIGGVERGLARGGHSALMFCENEPAAMAVLRNRFPGVPLHDDVRTLEHLPAETTLVVAGFPCQDLSQAGTTKGLSGSRSG